MVARIGGLSQRLYGSRYSSRQRWVMNLLRMSTVYFFSYWLMGFKHNLFVFVSCSKMRFPILTIIWRREFVVRIIFWMVEQNPISDWLQTVDGLIFFFFFVGLVPEIMIMQKLKMMSEIAPCVAIITPLIGLMGC